MSWRNYYKSGFTSPFGDPRPGGRKHRGQDISHSRQPGTIGVPNLREGTVVAKTVPSPSHGFGYGITIRSRLDDGNLYDISYSHGPWASSQKIGEHVPAGKIIIHEGMSGATKGSCVHIEQQRVGGGFLDPRPEINRVANGAGSTPTPTPPKQSNPFGISDVRGLQLIAKLNGGNTAPDNIWGSQSAEGFANFLRNGWGYKGNSVLGPVMWAAIARWLRARWDYVGNDVPGPVMRSALTRANHANYVALSKK